MTYGQPDLGAIDLRPSRFGTLARPCGMWLGSHTWDTCKVVNFMVDARVARPHLGTVRGGFPGIFDNPVKETKPRKGTHVSNLHKEWIKNAVSKSLARTTDASITVKDVPNKGDKKDIPFEKVEFALTDADGLTALWALAESARGTVKLEDGTEVPGENPINTLLTYAYGLNCRAKVRADFERQFEDPDKAVKKIAEMLVKSGQFKNYDKALAAAKAMRETADDDE